MPTVRNFGYLWDRHRVFWGRPNTDGTLLGKHADFGLIDFRDQKGVYILHTEDLKVVYVGQVGSGTQSLYDRLKQHTRSDKLWNRWRYFSWFGWRSVNMAGKTTYDRLSKHGGGAPNVSGSSEEFLDEIEAVLIQVVEPPLNRQGPKWKDTYQFKQADDDNLQLSDLPTIAVRQAEMMEEIKKLSKIVTKVK
jgi:hypothetical protein